MIMCHMLADTPAELHAMAEKIGMKREWFQPTSFPHYDVALSRRSIALAHGAVEVNRRGVYEIMKRVRNDPDLIALWREEYANHQR